MSNPLQFSVEFGKPRSDQPRRRGEPLRILFLTDLGETCQSRRRTQLVDRPMRLVDVDSFDDLFGDEKPVLHLPAGDVSLREIDDFHPDELCKNLPMIQTLKDLRSRLRAPASFEAAAQEVRAMLQAGSSKATEAVEPVVEEDSDTLSRLLGKPSDSSPDAAVPVKQEGALSQLIHEAVAAHIVADANPGAQQYIDAVDAAAEAHLRAVLHDPAFRSVEAAWRGLNLLVSNIETDEDLSIHIWNAAKSELIDAMGPVDVSPEHSVLHRRIVEERAENPFTLIVTDITFGPDPENLRLLATLAAMAGRSGGVVLAGAAPQMIGAESWNAIAAAPETLGEPDTGWTALRDSGLGSRIVALAPGFMLRTPYGRRLDPINSFFEFEEVENPGDANACFLWGTSSLLATVLIAQSFGQDGWDASLSANLAYGDLPFVPYEADGEKHMKPCAEALLPDRAAEAVLKTGVVPVVAFRNSNEVRLSWFQSITSADEGRRVGPFNV